MTKKAKDIWLPAPVEKDYRAAHDYLSLLFREKEADLLVRRLRAAKTSKRQAKDVLRASQTMLLDEDNPHVAHQLKKIKKGERMSPVLLIKGDGLHGVTLTIADGHHRICASWYLDEDAPIDCCMVPLPNRR